MIDTEGESRYIDAVPRLANKYEASSIHSVLDVGSWRLQINFNDLRGLELAASEAEKYTQMVEDKCLWAARFGIEGLGEGIVWIPIGQHWGNSDLFFKTKGEKHQEVTKTKKKSTIDPEVISSVNGFVEFAVTDNRLQKGIDYLVEMGKAVDMKSAGEFLKWVGNDVKRECGLELEDNELEWKQVAKAVNNRALVFFKARAMSLAS